MLVFARVTRHELGPRPGPDCGFSVRDCPPAVAREHSQAGAPQGLKYGSSPMAL